MSFDSVLESLSSGAALKGLKKASDRLARPTHCTENSSSLASQPGQSGQPAQPFARTLLVQQIQQATTGSQTSEEVFITSNSTYAQYLLSYLQETRKFTREVSRYCEALRATTRDLFYPCDSRRDRSGFFLLLALNEPMRK